MAPPPPSNLSLAERFQRLATTLQYKFPPPQSQKLTDILILAWFVGHATLLLCVLRYSLSYITFNSGSGWAAFSYRTSFLAAVVTYGIVVFKAYRARVKPGQPPQQLVLMLLGDENVQYLLISLVWLYSRQIPLALLPFTVYSVFHVATYTRTNLIPTFSPPKASPTGATPSAAPPKPQSGLANTIGKFVKEYYDASMMLVAGLEIALWFRLLLSSLTFSKGSWVLLTLYTVFLRARYHQSPFVQSAFQQGAARVDQQVQNPNVPPAARQGWEAVKGGVRSAVNATDVRKYLGGAANAQKKPQ